MAPDTPGATLLMMEPTDRMERTDRMELLAMCQQQADQLALVMQQLGLMDATAWQPPQARSTSIWQVRCAFRTPEHTVSGSQYFALFIWVSLLVAQYFLVREVCTAFHIPRDCRANQGPVQIMGDMQYLLSMGVVLATFTGMHWPDRLAYVFSFYTPYCRGVVFLLLFLGMAPAYGALKEIPSLATFTLSDTGIEGHHTPLIASLVGAAVVVFLHIWLAFCHNPLKGFLAYLVSRLFLFAFFAAYWVIKCQRQDVVFHFHHYAWGFLMASLAEFNHPMSTVSLACGTAVFVQGIAAYGADPIIAYAQA
uniref:Uncharacterized protein n=1 Tax=Zooxanthella nutricula TaxID=1333877 RepID=A0A7S2NQ44_9DINO